MMTSLRFCSLHLASTVDELRIRQDDSQVHSDLSENLSTRSTVSHDQLSYMQSQNSPHAADWDTRTFKLIEGHANDAASCTFKLQNRTGDFTQLLLVIKDDRTEHLESCSISYVTSDLSW
jgi:hypothetical protein